MSDDPDKRGRPDRDRINKDQLHEVRYWAQKFHVSSDELREAIDAVGPMASAVEQHLRRSH